MLRAKKCLMDFSIYKRIGVKAYFLMRAEHK